MLEVTKPTSGALEAPTRHTRLLIVSPMRNEAGHIEEVVAGMAAQTRPPDLWLILDDASDDGTLEILRQLEPDVPFMRVLSAKDGEVPASPPARDRLAMAAAPRAFNRALSTVEWRDYTHIGKLDGDIVLPPDYFEGLLDRFAADPRLGLAGGRLTEQFGTEQRLLRIPDYHVHGALKLYSVECFEAIGGVDNRLGWDTIDETYARMRGFHTVSFVELLGEHKRHWGSAQGRLRGRARHGECAYIVRYSLPWVTLRSLKVGAARPVGISGAAFLFGYLRAAARRAPKVDDPEFRRFVRRELRQRMLRPVRELTR